MKTIIVLAMHGAPPLDLPRSEVARLMGIHFQIEKAVGDDLEELQRQYNELDDKIRQWPRDADNDPFQVGSQEIAEQLSRATGHQVILGYNEFCAPSLDEALDQAAEQGAEKIIVTTPMMTRGGEHAESEIPSVIQNAQKRHPSIPIKYIWPFEAQDIARFLAAQIDRHIK
jgi:sirohydrochlorin cobaltochelatase